MRNQTESEISLTQLQDLFLLDKLLHKDGTELNDFKYGIPENVNANSRSKIIINTLNSLKEEFSQSKKEELQIVTQKIQRLIDEELFVRKHNRLFQKLTEREIEILKCIALGETNFRISEKLFISIETVKQHRKVIKKKTECLNTVDLVRFAQAFDLI